ncbi:hypothetical protein IWW56_006320, partial [Coemansia sp. RSA 2131]
ALVPGRVRNGGDFACGNSDWDTEQRRDRAGGRAASNVSAARAKPWERKDLRDERQRRGWCGRTNRRRQHSDQPVADDRATLLAAVRVTDP